jgi:mannan endo-1,4-beta-mannosidase
VKSLSQKPGPFSTAPDLGDDVVYQDEMVSVLVGKVGKAEDGGVRFYALDNEPALWPTTHPRIHPGRTTYAEMAARTEATAAAITAVDRGAQVLGGVMFGWSEYLSLSDAPDAQAENAKLGTEGATYLDFLLSRMKRMESAHKRRLVHGLDVHWYPEARGRKRVTESDISRKTVEARLQAPRSLWDPGYVEKSWIAATWGKPIRLIPWLRERIAERYPGTKLAITEYDFGAGNHISGGLAQADALGVFGREGVDLASYWGSGAGVGKLPPYVKAAFQLYRNYDGKGAAFGDTAVEATVADAAKASVFAATDSKHGGALTIVVINKNQRASYDGKISITGAGARSSCRSARVFTMQSPGGAIVPQPPVTVVNGTIEHRLPPLSATLFACGS